MSTTKRTFCCHRKLAELVPDHVLGHVDRDEAHAVVDGNGVSDHLGNDRRAPGPGLDDPLLSAVVHRLHLVLEVVVDEKTLLE
jgi:hypothetical protein